VLRSDPARLTDAEVYPLVDALGDAFHVDAEFVR
jgi:hypothetical protein